MDVSQERLLAELAESRDCAIDEARFLDPAWYHDQDLYEQEIERIFRKEWVCVARQDQVAEVGDYLTTTLLDEPLLLLRNDQEEIVCYSNVCRHRYYPVASGSGNTRLFTCPYHRWTYGRDGVLRGAPGMGGTDFDVSSCRLPEVRSEVWNGFVFVNLDTDAEPLAPRVLDASNMLAPYELANWRTTAIDDRTWSGNWKLVMENGMESLHHPGLHPETVEPQVPGLGAGDFRSFGAWTHLKVPFAEAASFEFARQTPRAVEGLDAADAGALCGYFIYPAFILPIFPAYANWLSIMPLSVSTTRVFTGLAMSDEYLDQLGPDIEATRAIALEQLMQVNNEDVQATEHLQRTTRSRFIERGPVTPVELGLLYFYQYLADRLV